MTVNRFMTPTRANYTQTYVDQYVPLPFELMQKRAQDEQTKFDGVRDNWGAIRSKMSEDLIQTDRDPLYSGIIQQVEGGINKALEEYDGDWRKLDSTVSQAASAYNKWKTIGTGAIALENKKIYDGNLEGIDKSNMAAQDKEIAKRLMYDRYDIQGGAATGNRFEPVQPYEMKDFPKKLLDTIKTIDPDQTSVASAGYDEDRNLIVDFHKDKRGVNGPKIKRAVEAALYNDPEFDSMVGFRYNAYNFYTKANGGEPVSYEKFKQNQFDAMFGGADAFAYSQETKRMGAKETAQAGERARIAHEIPEFTSNNRVHFGVNDTFKSIATSEGDVLWNLDQSYQQDLEGFKNQLFESFSSINPGEGNKPGFNKTLIDVAAAQGLDLKSKYDQRKFINGVANGTIQLNSFANTEARQKQLQQAAKETLKTWQVKDQIKLDAVETAANQGIIPKKVYEAYRSKARELKGVQSNLEKELQNAPDKASKDELKKLIRNIDGLLSTNIISRKDMMNVKNLVAGTDGKYYNKYEKYFDNYLNSVTDIQGELQEEERTAVSGILRERLNKPTGVNITWTSSIPMMNKSGKVDAYEGAKFVEGMQKQLANHKQSVLQAKVHDIQTGDASKTLQEVLWAEANELSGQYGEMEVHEIYKELEKRAFDDHLQIANTYNPVTGQPMIKLGGKYAIDLSTSPTSINFDLSNVPESVKTELVVNTYVGKALIDGASNTEVAPGIYIQTKEPNQVDKVDRSFDQQYSDGSYYRIRVDTGELGGGAFAEYKDLPADTGRRLLTQIDKLNKSVDENGMVYLPTADGDVRLLPLQTAVKDIVSQYAK